MEGEGEEQKSAGSGQTNADGERSVIGELMAEWLMVGQGTKTVG